MKKYRYYFILWYDATVFVISKLKKRLGLIEHICFYVHIYITMDVSLFTFSYFSKFELV